MPQREESVLNVIILPSPSRRTAPDVNRDMTPMTKIFTVSGREAMKSRVAS